MYRQTLDRMLSNVDSKYDKKEGSIISDLLSAVGIEITDLEIYSNKVLLSGFVDTAEGENLDRLVGEVDIIRKSATRATGMVTITGRVGKIIPVGSAVASEVEYTTISLATIPTGGSVKVPVICSVPGTMGNADIGAINSFPVTINGLYSVTNEAEISNGYDEETDEELRERYYIKVRTPATSGNIYHYQQWAMESPNVGGALVVPLWDGNGTVKVIIMSPTKRAVTPKTVTEVYNYIETVRPIGATVTIESASELSIEISLSVTLMEGYVIADVDKDIAENIKEYLKEITFTGKSVSYAKIGSLIIDTEGVLDYENLQVNVGTSNIPLSQGQIPVLAGIFYE